MAILWICLSTWSICKLILFSFLADVVYEHRSFLCAVNWVFYLRVIMRVRYCLTLATGVVECLCFCGVIFGWASLVFTLKTEGFFGSLCVNTTGVNTTQEQGQFHLLYRWVPLYLHVLRKSIQPALESLKRTSLFFVCPQTAASRMNSSRSYSPSAPLWTPLCLYRVGSSLTTLVPQCHVSVQCEYDSCGLGNWLSRFNAHIYCRNDKHLPVIWQESAHDVAVSYRSKMRPLLCFSVIVLCWFGQL